MAKRDNHYETAFEAWLRVRQIPYVAIDETRRALLAGESIKNLDFIVSPPGDLSWLVDVKGRRFPASGEQKQYWKNWSTRDDLRGLEAWERLLGPGFQGLLVFAYQIAGDRSPLPASKLFEHRRRLYGFIGVRLRDYASFARPISKAWQTLALGSRQFREIGRPVEEILLPTPAAAEPFPDAAPQTTIETVDGPTTGSSTL